MKTDLIPIQRKLLKMVLLLSSILNYVSDGISNTYNETVNFWGEDGSIANGADAVIWSASNPDKVAQATKKGIVKSADEFKDAVISDSIKLVFIVGVLFFVYKFIGAKASKMGAG